MFVYVIAQPGASIAKVGRAGDVSGRLHSLRLGSPVPLELRGHWEGDSNTEAFLHQCFVDRQHHGEWFEFGDDDPVALVTAALGRDQLPLPELVDRRRTRSLARPKPEPISPRGGWESKTAEFARALKRLRLEAGIPIRGFAHPDPSAELVAVPNARIQRAERGSHLLAADQLRTVLEMAGADLDCRERLARLLTEAREEQVDLRLAESA